VNWGHLIWAVVVAGLVTSAVVVMGTFGLVSRPLSDFAMLLYLRLALLSGALYLVFNRVSSRQGRVAARRQEPDRDLARRVAINTEWDRSLLHQRRVGSHTRRARRVRVALRKGIRQFRPGHTELAGG
jgi:cell division protein FtsL